MRRLLTTVAIRQEHDVVLARQRARHIAGLLSYDQQDQVRIATAVSEIARNVFRYAKNGKAEFSISELERTFDIVVTDKGPGIPDLKRILDGNYVSSTGMGMGIVGARRLMDRFEIESSPSGTSILLSKNLPSRVTRVDAELTARVAEQLAKLPTQDPFEELQRQNQELLSTLDQLQQQKNELAELNRELEDTNRGVVALYAELDERADYLRRASEMKTLFLSNMTHEFRTPLNSILSLCRILLDRIDGPLESEQERQVLFIQKAASDLTELVNDLLDLAKVEAGKVKVAPAEFRVNDLFSALRGMLRPLLAHNSSISLSFEVDESVPSLFTDESKVSQILRNLISNAIKFTERGEVRVSCTADEGDSVRFAVADTGIGIAAENQEMIFQEFSQVEGPHQAGKKGTGLGLPLSRKLAETLGGSLSVISRLGSGSTFELRLPRRYSGPQFVSAAPESSGQLDPKRTPVLIVEDNKETLFVYEKFLKGTGFQVLAAQTISEARRALESVRPAAIILDVLLQHESTWDFLAELKRSEETRSIPVLVVTMVENQHKAIALGADGFASKPVSRQWLITHLTRLVPRAVARQLLIVDDDPASRYILSSLLADLPFALTEATGGREALSLARLRNPSAIFLDLKMPDLNGFQVLKELKADPLLRSIPVIIHTSKHLTAAERRKLQPDVACIVEKAHDDRVKSLADVLSALKAAGVLNEEATLAVAAGP